VIVCFFFLGVGNGGYVAFFFRKREGRLLLSVCVCVCVRERVLSFVFLFF
jgi:hypothetical protein